MVRIRKTKHFRHALRDWPGEGPLKIYLTEREKKISSRHSAVLDQMIDVIHTHTHALAEAPLTLFLSVLLL